MSKIAIITDSTAYIPKETREAKNISMVPLNVVFGEEAYKEEQEITAEQFYEEMKAKEDLPTTSQPAIGLFEEKYQELAKEGYDEAIVITLSSGISGTFQTAVAAGNMVDDIKVHVFDSEISCMVQGFFVLKAAELAAAGETSESILKKLDEMKANTRAYFMADDLSHLHRGGRLNGAQLIVGSLLQIKPVLHFENKVIVPYEKVRTEKKAMGKILSMLDEDAKKHPLKITVIHANRQDKADLLATDLRDQYPDSQIDVSYFGPVIGTHLGEGSMGIGWVKL
ncbi:MULTISPECIES: DegV family protein [Bacillaceae]|uniref:DegV family protein n=1 Tax=Evansella alkalicola TaxID=745819 RepID=A0ABS6JTJ1_9BACI|nr:MULTISPECIES: DegV family protein [Bacillaceae]MBU9721735.1 DegV family protein [Bacillus alkalicola]